MVKNPPAMQSGRSLAEGWQPHSSILAWRIPWTEESHGLQSMGPQKVRHDWSTNTHTHTHTHTHGCQLIRHPSQCISLFDLVFSCSIVSFCDPTNCTTNASLSFTISPSWLKLMSVELVMPSNHLIICYPFLLLPSIFPSIRVFSKESTVFGRCPWKRIWLQLL